MPGRFNDHHTGAESRRCQGLSGHRSNEHGFIASNQAGTEIVANALTGAFWNVTTRLLDGFKLLGLPETGINVDRLPGPRGPVTFLDLHLRQFVVTPR